MYKYKGPPTGKRGRPKVFGARVDIKQPDCRVFELIESSAQVRILSGLVYSKALKRDIKLCITLFFKQGKEVCRKLYFTTDLELQATKIVAYYRSRFQIEFLYRDAKQFTGLNDCQARSKEKLDFHFNASLTAINIAKADHLKAKTNELKPFSMAEYKTLYNNTLILELFMSKFAINPNTPKNQKIVKELLNYGKIAA